MLKIAICDTDQTNVKRLRDLLVKIFFAHSEIEIYCYENGEALLEAIRLKTFSADLLFLEMNMDDVEGTEIAGLIRKYAIDVDIVFLANSPDNVYEGYTYNAFAYYLKPVREDMLQRDMLRYLEERRNISETLTINTKSREIHIPIQKILYFKSEKRMITVHTLIGESSFYAKMDEIENMVKGKGFIRCHQSYLVNQNMIDSIGRKEIIVQGREIPMSRKYYESMDVREDETTFVRINRSLAMNLERGGAIVFVKGKLLGTIIRIQCDTIITVGRDGKRADIVLDDKVVSGLHCGIQYNSKSDDYTVWDYSSNGIYNAKGERMAGDSCVKLKAGETVWIGNNENIIQLG